MTTDRDRGALEFSLDVHLFDHAMTTVAAARLVDQVDALSPRARVLFQIVRTTIELFQRRPLRSVTAMRLIVLETFFIEVRGVVDSNARAFLADFRDAAMRDPANRSLIAMQRASGGDNFWSRPVPASTLPNVVVDLATLHTGDG